MAETVGYDEVARMIGGAVSKIRENHIFGGLPVQQRYDNLLCGIAVVDTRSGRQIGLFE